MGCFPGEVHAAYFEAARLPFRRPLRFDEQRLLSAPSSPRTRPARDGRGQRGGTGTAARDRPQKVCRGRLSWQRRRPAVSELTRACALAGASSRRSAARLEAAGWRPPRAPSRGRRRWAWWEGQRRAAGPRRSPPPRLLAAAAAVRGAGAPGAERRVCGGPCAVAARCAARRRGGAGARQLRGAVAGLVGGEGGRRAAR